MGHPQVHDGHEEAVEHLAPAELLPLPRRLNPPRAVAVTVVVVVATIDRNRSIDWD
nr:unnamed protein product [Digitaria exilis]